MNFDEIEKKAPILNTFKNIPSSMTNFIANISKRSNIILEEEKKKFSLKIIFKLIKNDIDSETKYNSLEKIEKSSINKINFINNKIDQIRTLKRTNFEKTDEFKEFDEESKKSIQKIIEIFDKRSSLSKPGELKEKFKNSLFKITNEFNFQFDKFNQNLILLENQLNYTNIENEKNKIKKKLEEIKNRIVLYHQIIKNEITEIHSIFLMTLDQINLKSKETTKSNLQTLDQIVSENIEDLVKSKIKNITLKLNQKIDCTQKTLDLLDNMILGTKNISSIKKKFN